MASPSTAAASATTVILPPGLIPSTAIGGQSTPGLGPGTTANDAATRGLSSDIIALIATFSTLGGLGIVALIAYLVWRKLRDNGMRGMSRLSERGSGGSSPAVIEPYMLSTPTMMNSVDNGGLTQLPVRPGRPTSPNFFVAQPFGAQNDYQGSQPVSLSVYSTQPATAYDPFRGRPVVFNYPFSGLILNCSQMTPP